MNEPPLNPSMASVILVNSRCNPRHAPVVFFMFVQDQTCSAPLKFNQIHLAMRDVRTESTVDTRLADGQYRSRSPWYRPRSSVIAKSTYIVQIIHCPLVRQKRVLASSLLASTVAVEFIHKDGKETVHSISCADDCTGTQNRPMSKFCHVISTVTWRGPFSITRVAELKISMGLRHWRAVSSNLFNEEQIGDFIAIFIIISLIANAIHFQSRWQ